MFTGLIQELGRIRRVDRGADSARLMISAPVLAGDLIEGESVAVDGCCLTVERHDGDTFTAFASSETLAKTTLQQAVAGQKVNLERALAVGDRLGGHIVAGHVDDRATVASIRLHPDGSALCAYRLPETLLDQVIPKGSIAIDGVSLTIASLSDDRIEIAVIPETWTRTNLNQKKVGAHVNIETDLIGKYVIRQMRAMGTSAPAVAEGGLTLGKLFEAGF